MLKKLLYTFILITSGIGFVTLSSCKKEDKFITSANALLSTNKDTIKFDTVFTTAGSVTNLFKVFNNNNQKLNLSSVKLMGGSASFFKINVDGLSGTQFNNIEISANDSIYVYVTVNVNPNSNNLPFVVQDSVQIQYNGNTKFVQLQAFGQNAIFLNNQKITGSVTWNNNLPYVILGGLRVDTTAILNITKGAKIYVHANAPFIVDGTLITTGEKWDSTKIVFRGDRLDEPYKNYPASWPGIYFRGQSKNNVLQYTNLYNAFQAIITEGPSINANPKVTLNECIIDNAYDAGIFAINSNINAKNCLISNCGTNVGITYGGIYNFTHCTIASYSNSNILHKDPVLFATNYVKQANNTFIAAPLTAAFTNCIFWGEFGTAEDEVVVDKLGTPPYNINFNKCIYKVKTALNPLITSTGGLVNIAPQFDSINTSRSYYNFRLKSTSPAINTGAISTVNVDLDGKLRPLGLPDIGCYEKQ
jgi:hypothetical protein